MVSGAIDVTNGETVPTPLPKTRRDLREASQSTCMLTSRAANGLWPN